MQNTQIFSVAGVCLIFAALLANHAIKRLEIAPLQRLPVQTFPRVIGEWKAGPDEAMDDEVKRKLTTALIMDRTYTDPAHRHVDLLLLSATRDSDYHDPNVCFPAQGFVLSTGQNMTIAGQTVHVMTAARDAQKYQVLYWWTDRGFTDTHKLARAQLAKLATLRDRLTNQQGQSMFVRLVTEAGPEAGQTFHDFITQIQPSLKALSKTNTKT